ncbi:MAG: ABC transporter ATP-binding protein [Planctomycetes bacterium]|nr:ABC transporter ATP-binding protein [Planctomycetota bacterium]
MSAGSYEIAVSFTDVSKKLSGRQILDHLNFEVCKGETFVIIGYSGTGKSVTLRHMVGLMRPDEGSIRIEGDEITTMSRHELEIMRRRFGVLFQSGALIAWLTLFENVELPLLEHTKMSKKKRAEIVQQKLEIVNLWQDRDKYPAEISGGMKKRAGLARAIALDPDLVLYDEPSSGLDPVIANEIDKLINRLRDEHGMTQIVVTHDMDSAYTIANRIAMFHKGSMLQIGTPDEIQTSSIPEVQHFITGGKEGQVSRRSNTAIIRGMAPGMLSQRSAEAMDAKEAEEAEAAVATEEPQEGYVLLSEEEAAKSESPEPEPRSLEPEESHENP